jgi:hypothetical protein
MKTEFDTLREFFAYSEENDTMKLLFSMLGAETMVNDIKIKDLDHFLETVKRNGLADEVRETIAKELIGVNTVEDILSILEKHMYTMAESKPSSSKSSDALSNIFSSISEAAKATSEAVREMIDKEDSEFDSLDDYLKSVNSPWEVIEKAIKESEEAEQKKQEQRAQRIKELTTPEVTDPYYRIGINGMMLPIKTLAELDAFLDMIEDLESGKIDQFYAMDDTSTGNETSTVTITKIVTPITIEKVWRN